MPKASTGFFFRADRKAVILENKKTVNEFHLRLFLICTVYIS